MSEHQGIEHCSILCRLNYKMKHVKEVECGCGKPHKMEAFSTQIVHYVFAARKPLHRRCLVTKRVSEANDTVTKPFRVGEEWR
jgi:hypothetical protein